MIEYIIESTLCFVTFYIIYEVFFKQYTNYKVNRILLLFSTIFSVLVPLLKISLTTIPFKETSPTNRIIENLPVSNYIPISDLTTISPIEDNSISISSILIGIYIVITVLLLCRFAFHLRTLYSKWKISEKVNYKGHTLSLIEEKIPPFTFFQAIFINKEVYIKNTIKEELIIHEIAHKYQWHSIDILYIELLQAFFWFNPLVYLFSKKIKANHEYLADDFVVRCGIDSKEYANQILNHTFPHKIAGFASAFNNHLTIKNRLIMLSKFQDKKPTAYRLIILIPILLLLFISTAFTSDALLPDDTLTASETITTDPLIGNIGTVYGESIVWSSENNKVYISGDDIRVVHGDNDFTLRGRTSYLGDVFYFIMNGQLVVKDTPIAITGKKCTVIKLSSKDAIQKYGVIAKQGAVEITTESP